MARRSLLAALLSMLIPAGAVRSQPPFPGYENIRGVVDHGNGFCFSTALLDVDGDGVDEILFGEVFDDGRENLVPNSGAVLVLSGRKTGTPQERSVLHELWNPDTLLGGAGDAAFGLALAVATTSSGTPLVAVGAPFADQPETLLRDTGGVYVFAGPDLVLVGTAYGEAAGDRLGSAIVFGPDLDGDGTPELLVGAPRSDEGGPTTGSVIIFRVLPGGLLPVTIVRGSVAGGELGSSLAFATPSFRPGGLSDFLAGAPGAGSVAVIDASTGSVVATLTGPGRFGETILLAGDHDGDGASELVVSSPDRGRLSLHRWDSGSNPAWVVGRPGLSEWRLGASMALVEDLTGDGLDEIAIGAPDLSRRGLGRRGGFGILSPRADLGPPSLLLGSRGSTAGGRLGFALASGEVLDAQGRRGVGLVACAPVAEGRGIERSGRALVIDLEPLRSSGGAIVLESLEGTYSGTATHGETVAFRRRIGVPDDWIIAASSSDSPGVPGTALGPFTGVVYVRSGSNPPGRLLQVFNGASPDERFGAAIAPVAGPPFDGSDRYLVVGVPEGLFKGRRTGLVRIYDLDSGELTDEFAPEDADVDGEFGGALARLGQVFGARQKDMFDNDQIAIGAPGAREDLALEIGRVYVYTITDEGRVDRARRHVLRNIDPQRRAGDRFGAALAGPNAMLFDAGVDRRNADLVVGAPLADLQLGNDTYIDAGRVFVYGVNRGLSGFAPPLVLDNLAFPGDPSGDQFGFAVSGAGDLAPGGGYEIVVGSPFAECRQRSEVGRVTVYTFNSSVPPSVSFVGDCALPQTELCPGAGANARFGFALDQYRTMDGIANGFMVGAPGLVHGPSGEAIGGVFLFDNVSTDPPCLLWEELPAPPGILGDTGRAPEYGSAVAWSFNPIALPGEDDLEGRILAGAPFLDHVDDVSYRRDAPRRIEDLGRLYMIPLVLGRPRE
jgi:hypothetical protein